jgi:hypothetical protein
VLQQERIASIALSEPLIMAPSNKIQLKSASIPHLHIKFLDASGQGFHLEKGWKHTSDTSSDSHTFLVNIYPKDGSLNIREARDAQQGKERLFALVKIPRLAYKLVQFSREVTSFQFSIRLNDGHQLAHEYGGQQVDNDKSTHLKLGFQEPDLHRIREIEFRVPDFHRDAKIDPALIQGILDSETVADPKTQVGPYISRQLEAINAEAINAEEKRGLLNRKKMSTSVRQVPSFTDRYYVQFHPDPKDPKDKGWTLEAGQKIWLEPAVDGQGGLFSTPCTPLEGKGSGWRATTRMLPNAIVGIIDNATKGMDLVALKAMLVPDCRVDLKTTLDPEDPEADKASKAVKLVKEAMNREEARDTSEHEFLAASYTIPIRPTYLVGVPFDESATVPFVVADPALLTKKTSYQLEQESHSNCVRGVFANPRGLFMIQGPPAAGKTTLVAKVVGIAATHTPIKGKKIVVAAHTNEAVRVACLRTTEVLSSKFDVDLDTKVCLVLSDAKAEAARLETSKPGPLQRFTLDAHMDRIVEKDPAHWSDYRAGQAEKERSGRIEDPVLRKLHAVEQGKLVAMVRKQVTIFFATMAMVHTGHKVFGKRQLNCGLLVVDEGSQVTDPVFAMAHLALNPDRILVAGDENQLSPYAETDLAKEAWVKEPLFKKLRQKAPSEMLDVQYRTSANLYAGTLAHYPGHIASHASTQDRPKERELKEILGRISFTDVKGKVFRLKGTAHFFDVVNGAHVDNVGLSRSSVNPLEVQFVQAFIEVLIKAGLGAEDIMALTGYSGQYERLKPLEDKYPGLRSRKIDSSQGDEANVVVLSTVRVKNVGFMSLERRQNVATSR